MAGEARDGHTASEMGAGEKGPGGGAGCFKRVRRLGWRWSGRVVEVEGELEGTGSLAESARRSEMEARSGWASGLLE